MAVGEWSLVHWLDWSGVEWSSVCDQTPAGQHHDLTTPTSAMTGLQPAALLLTLTLGLLSLSNSGKSVNMGGNPFTLFFFVI